MKFSITGFFKKGDQICSFLRIWSRLLKKSLMETFSVSKMQKIMLGENYYIFPALKIKKLVLVGKILWRFNIILHIWLICFLLY